MPDWLWQAIIANWIWELLVLASGVTIAWLRHKNVSWLPVLFYGFAGCVLMSVMIYTFLGRAILSRQQPETTSENVEKNIRAWADAFQLGVTKLQPDPNGDFGLAIALKGGNSLEIHKLKQSPAYLQIQSQLVLSPEHQKTLAKLTEEQSAFVTEELSLELARSKIGFTIVGPPVQGEPQIQLVVLMKGVPISGLTESTFAGYMDEMDSAIKLSRTTTALLLDHGPLRDTATGPHPTPAR